MICSWKLLSHDILLNIVPYNYQFTHQIIYWPTFQFLEHGYVTSHAADAPSIGAFQFRLMGFKDPPTDFYPRPFFQAAERTMKGGRNQCINSQTVSKTMFGYINEVFRIFPDTLKFFFSFNGDIYLRILLQIFHFLL